MNKEANGMTERLNVLSKILFETFVTVQESVVEPKIITENKSGFNVLYIPLELRIAAKKSYLNDFRAEYVGNAWPRREMYEHQENSLSSGRIEHILKSKYGLRGWQINPHKFQNGINGYEADYMSQRNKDISLCIPDIDKNREIICNVMSEEGYSYAYEEQSDYDDKAGVKWIVMLFTPNKASNVTDYVRRRKYLYHVTRYDNVDSILKNGLLPKTSKNTRYKYSNRVYLWIEEDINKAYTYSYDIFDMDKNDSKIALLCVDVTKIASDVEFFLDPFIERAIYTNNSIISDSINLVRIFEKHDIDRELNKRTIYVETEEEKAIERTVKEIARKYDLTVIGQIIGFSDNGNRTEEKKNNLKAAWNELRDKGIDCDNHPSRTEDDFVYFMFYKRNYK